MYILAPRRCLVQCLGLFLGVFLLVSGVSGQVASLKMRVPGLPAGTLDTGALPGSQPMRLTLYLTPTVEREAALVSFLTAVQAPGNAAYHAWLTPAEFGQEFGSTSDQLAAVTAFAQAAGLTVESESASGLRVVVSGSVAQVEAAMAPSLHGVQVGQAMYYANTATPSLPTALAGDVVAVDGLSDLPAGYPMTVVADGAASANVAKDSLKALSAVAEAGTARVVALHTASCLEDVDAATQAAMELALQQASAEGMTVLAETGCGARGSAGFPSELAEVTSVAIAPGTTPPVAPTLTEARPVWQTAMGLPADGLRHEPDVTVSGVDALAQAMMTILAKAPAGADGSAARLGNVNATLYELAAEPGLYTQPDKAMDVWEAPTGLGVVDLAKLEQFFPRGSLSDNVSIAVSNGGYVTHGASLTFSSTVTDTSGQGGGAVPTGTVTFTTNTGVTLGSTTLSGGTGSVSYNQLPGGSYTVTVAYSGNGTYAANNSITTGFAVGAETVTVSGSEAAEVPVGSMMTLNVSVTAPSGVGSPSGVVTVTPQGTSDTSTYTGTLSGGTATTTAAIQAPAVQGGPVTFLAQCTTSASFTCSTPARVTATNTPGTATVTVSVSPNPPVAGSNATYTATVTGPGGKYPVPTGNITFYDNGTSLGSATLSNGSATLSTVNTTNAATHTITATYGGDNNYATATGTAGTTAASSTTTTLTVSPNPPVSGSTTTLSATIGYTLTNGMAPSGSVSFFEDNVPIGSGTVSGGVATYTSTTLSSATAHSFYAVYSGDTNFKTSTSATVATSASSATAATSVALSINPNPPSGGTLTTLTAMLSYTLTNSTAPTGTVGFYEDGTLLGSGTVSGGAATYSSSSITTQVSHTFYAVYSGDSIYKTSTSPTVTTSAGLLTTTTVLTISPNPPVSGSLTTLSATVVYPGVALPTGTVTFYQDGAALGSGTVSNAAATYSSTGLSGSRAHSFYAMYSGDANYKTSTSSTLATAANTGTSTTVTVSASSSSVATGGTVTVSAVVTPSSVVNGAAPTGTVTFTSAQGTLCSGTVSSNAASCVATLTTAGTQSITATYSGDTNYASSVSAAPATVTVGSTAAGVLTATASPSASVMYGTTVALASTLTPTTAVTGGPAGTVTFALTGTVAATYTASLVASGTTSATAMYSIPAPTPGTYVVTATCASTNVACTGLSATASLVTIKGNTVTTLTASPTSPLAGQTTTFTATVAPATTANAAALAPTGTVTFYINGTATVETVSNGVATFSTVLTATTGNYVTAVYSGDTNWNGSTSSQIIVNIAPIATTSSLTANETTALYTANVVLTDAVLAPGTTTNPTPAAPAGTVTFYDLYNGQTVLLGTASLTQVVPGDSIAQLSTTGLMKGTHNITALFGQTTTFASSTTTMVVNITDYGVSYSPGTLSLTPGSGGAAIATVTAYNGFSGQVVLGCTPPAGTGMTCSFSPAVLTAAGTSVLSVTTTAATAAMKEPRMGRETGISLAAVSLGTLLLGLLLPGTRRRPTLLLAVIAAAALGVSIGCTTVGTVNTIAGGGSGGTGGTPQGTQLLSITTQGTDGVTTVRHDTQFQVTVQ